MQYYCHECAIRIGLLRPTTPISLTATEYQLDKYLKHTSPVTDYDFYSVFTNPRSETYERYIVTALASGSVQVDNQGRTNVVWVASEHTGITYKDGRFLASTNAVKVVFHDDDRRFTDSQSTLRNLGHLLALRVDVQFLTSLTFD